MSGLLSKPSMPAPAPVPMQPLAPDNTEAERQRREAERAALADRTARGRAATVVGGGVMAQEMQLARGAESQARRFASRELLG